MLIWDANSGTLWFFSRIRCNVRGRKGQIQGCFLSSRQQGGEDRDFMWIEGTSPEKEKILPREGAGITNRDVRKISAKVQVTWKDVAKPLGEIHLVWKKCFKLQESRAICFNRTALWEQLHKDMLNKIQTFKPRSPVKAEASLSLFSPSVKRKLNLWMVSSRRLLLGRGGRRVQAVSTESRTQ